MISAQQLTNLLEAVYGHQVIAFHRTDETGLYHLENGQSFLPSPTGTYGPGIYLTSDFESQQTPYMIENYGDYIIKCRVFMQDFLILDPPIATQVYGNNWQWTTQVEHFLQKTGPSTPRMNVKRDISLMNVKDYPHYTSSLARVLLSVFRQNLHIYLGVNGLVFTGRSDGKVIVVYNKRYVTPMSWIHAPQIMYTPPSNWQPVSAIARETLLPSLGTF